MTSAAQPLRRPYIAPHLLRLGAFPGITAMAGGGNISTMDSPNSYGSAAGPGGTS